jgi:hypothetical protein
MNTTAPLALVATPQPLPVRPVIVVEVHDSDGAVGVIAEAGTTKTNCKPDIANAIARKLLKYLRRVLDRLRIGLG